MLAGELGVPRDRSRRREVEIALEGKTQRAAGGSELVQAHVAEFRVPEAEVVALHVKSDKVPELRRETSLLRLPE